MLDECYNKMWKPKKYLQILLSVSEQSVLLDNRI